METMCPYCGMEFDVDDSEFGRYVKCVVCGKGFVIWQGHGRE